MASKGKKKSDSKSKKSDSKKKTDSNPKKPDSKSALRTAPSAEPVKKPKSGSPTGVVTAKKGRVSGLV